MIRNLYLTLVDFISDMKVHLCDPLLLQNQGPAKKPRNERIVIPSKEKLSIVRRPVAPEKVNNLVCLMQLVGGLV